MASEVYEHQPLNEDITAISGHYVITGETRLQYLEQEILYVTGYSVVDSS